MALERLRASITVPELLNALQGPAVTQYLEATARLTYSRWATTAEGQAAFTRLGVGYNPDAIGTHGHGNSRTLAAYMLEVVAAAFLPHDSEFTTVSLKRSKAAALGRITRSTITAYYPTVSSHDLVRYDTHHAPYLPPVETEVAYSDENGMYVTPEDVRRWHARNPAMKRSFWHIVSAPESALNSFESSEPALYGLARSSIPGHYQFLPDGRAAEGYSQPLAGNWWFTADGIEGDGVELRVHRVAQYAANALYLVTTERTAADIERPFEFPGRITLPVSLMATHSLDAPYVHRGLFEVGFNYIMGSGELDIRFLHQRLNQFRTSHPRETISLRDHLQVTTLLEGLLSVRLSAVSRGLPVEKFWQHVTRRGPLAIARHYMAPPLARHWHWFVNTLASNPYTMSVPLRTIYTASEPSVSIMTTGVPPRRTFQGCVDLITAAVLTESEPVLPGDEDAVLQGIEGHADDFDLLLPPVRHAAAVLITYIPFARLVRAALVRARWEEAVVLNRTITYPSLRSPALACALFVARNWRWLGSLLLACFKLRKFRPLVLALLARLEVRALSAAWTPFRSLLRRFPAALALLNHLRRVQFPPALPEYDTTEPDVLHPPSEARIAAALHAAHATEVAAGQEIDRLAGLPPVPAPAPPPTAAVDPPHAAHDDRCLQQADIGESHRCEAGVLLAEGENCHLCEDPHSGCWVVPDDDDDDGDRDWDLDDDQLRGARGHGTVLSPEQLALATLYRIPPPDRRCLFDAIATATDTHVLKVWARFCECDPARARSISSTLRMANGMDLKAYSVGTGLSFRLDSSVSGTHRIGTTRPCYDIKHDEGHFYADRRPAPRPRATAPAPATVPLSERLARVIGPVPNALVTANKSAAKALLKNIKSRHVFKDPRWTTSFQLTLKNTVERSLPRRCAVRCAYGIWGSGKSYGFKQVCRAFYQERPLDDSWCFVAPTEDLRDQIKASLGLASEHAHHAQTLEFPFFSPGLKCIVLDDLGLYPPGMVSLLMYALPGLTSIFATGDPSQAVYSCPVAGNTINSRPAEIDVYAPQADAYRVTTFRSPADIASDFGVRSRNAEPGRFFRGYRRRDHAAQILPTSKQVPNASELYGHAYSVISSQGCEFPHVDFHVDEFAVKASSRHWCTALTRHSRSLCLLMSPNVPAAQSPLAHAAILLATAQTSVDNAPIDTRLVRARRIALRTAMGNHINAFTPAHLRDPVRAAAALAAAEAGLRATLGHGKRKAPLPSMSTPTEAIAAVPQYGWSLNETIEPDAPEPTAPALSCPALLYPRTIPPPSADLQPSLLFDIRRAEESFVSRTSLTPRAQCVRL